MNDAPTKVGTCWTREAMLIRLTYLPSLLSNRILIIKPPFNSSLFSKGIRVRPVSENPDTTLGAPGSTRSECGRTGGWDSCLVRTRWGTLDGRWEFKSLIDALSHVRLKVAETKILDIKSSTTGHLFVSNVILRFYVQRRGKIPGRNHFSALILYRFSSFFLDSNVSNRHQLSTEGISWPFPNWADLNHTSWLIYLQRPIISPIGEHLVTVARKKLPLTWRNIEQSQTQWCTAIFPDLDRDCFCLKASSFLFSFSFF